MKKYLCLVWALLFVIKASADLYPPFTQPEREQFQKELSQAIDRAEKEVKNQEYNATRRDVAPTTSSQVQFQNAMVQLDVKKTLVNNFLGTESITSPVVRQKLLQVLNKSLIMPSDLADLQTVVLQEKARMHAAQTTEPTPTTPTQPPQPTTPSNTGSSIPVMGQ